MAVSIIFSSTNGGSSEGQPLSHGTTLIQGGDSVAQTIYLRHDGTNAITSCGLYMQAFAGTYTGDFTAAVDKAELLAWGDASGASTYGGIKMNLNATGSFPDASWPTLANKDTVDGYGFTIRTGVGDSATSPISILTSTGATSTGTIQAGTAPNVRFQMKLSIPSAEDTSGTRLFGILLTYNYTS